VRKSLREEVFIAVVRFLFFLSFFPSLNMIGYPQRQQGSKRVASPASNTFFGYIYIYY
jgi:hypothetical protein